MSSSYQKLESDLKDISEALGKQCKKIGLFGSVVTKGLDNARDIDLAIFMESPSLDYINDKLRKLDLEFSYKSKNVAYTYGGGGGVTPEKTKEFDIVVLDSNNPDSYFMSKNKHCLSYLQ